MVEASTVLQSAPLITKLQDNNPNRSSINSYFVSRLLDDLCSGFFCFVLVPAYHVYGTTSKKRVNRGYTTTQKRCLET